MYSGKPIGLFAFSHDTAASLAAYSQSAIQADADLHDWITSHTRGGTVLLNFGCYTEFIIRRCFLPGPILVFAFFNQIQLIVYMAAIGAHGAWIISLRSLITSSREQSRTAAALPLQLAVPANVPLNIGRHCPACGLVQMREIETGSFAPEPLSFDRSRSVRVLSWNINPGLRRYSPSRLAEINKPQLLSRPN